MLRLAGQRVLLIAPRFFGYEADIIRQLAELGAEVDHLPDRPLDSPLQKAVTRFRPELIIRRVDALYRRQLQAWGRSHYDLVLVINGQTLSTPLLAELTASFPRARFVLYMWDSFRNRKSAVGNLRFFSDCLSFDPDCAAEHGLRFRPLFFTPGFAQPPAERFDYHLSFIGTAHTDRYAIVSQIARGLPPGHQFYRYLYLQAPWVYHLLRVGRPALWRSRIGEFNFTPLARAEVLRVFFASRAILDIEHPKQTGLTIRTLETLGASRKLVTTNARVREYDFYHPDNICVFDRRAPALPASFLATPYRPLSSETYRKYSLAGWLEEVLRSHDPAAGAKPPSS